MHDNLNPSPHIAGEDIIVIDHLYKNFGNIQAVCNFSMTVKRGGGSSSGGRELSKPRVSIRPARLSMRCWGTVRISSGKFCRVVKLFID